jgi:hypothetical protein
MITAKIDVSKIDKEELYKGQKGTYLDIVMYPHTDDTGSECPDQYGNDGVIKQGLSKASREAKKKQPILGNYKVKKDGFAASVKPAKAFQNRPAPARVESWDMGGDDDTDLPF